MRPVPPLRGMRAAHAARTLVGALRSTGSRAAFAIALLLGLAAAASAQDSDQPRVYLGTRIGESNPITKANDVASFSIGANANRYVGFEFSVDGYELYLSSPTRDRVAELGITGLTPQLRLRYPLLGDRLVPYFLAGAGLAVAQINDADEPTEWASSGSLTSLRALGVVGGGIEYYISDDIAAGVEGKYMITGSKTYDAAGSKNEVDMNAGLLTFGLRMFYPELNGSQERLAAARRGRRVYVNPRFGGALRRAGDVFPGIHTAPEQTLFGSNFAPLYAVGVGVQLSEYLDIEVSGSNYELRLDFDGKGAECAVFPLLLQPKLHVPMSDLRLDPYVLVGVGGEILEPNDSGGIRLEAGGSGVIGAVGGGFDYFFTSDVALGLEGKYLFSRGHTLQVQGGEPLRGDLDSFFVSVGIRAFLFDL